MLKARADPDDAWIAYRVPRLVMRFWEAPRSSRCWRDTFPPDWFVVRDEKAEELERLLKKLGFSISGSYPVPVDVNRARIATTACCVDPVCGVGYNLGGRKQIKHNNYRSEERKRQKKQRRETNE